MTHAHPIAVLLIFAIVYGAVIVEFIIMLRKGDS